LTLEIKRSEHSTSSVFLLVFESADSSWRHDIATKVREPRSALAELAGGRYALTLVRDSTDEAMRAVGDVVQSVRRRGQLNGAGLVALTGGNVAMRTGDELLWLAEELCARACRHGAGHIEAIRVSHESWPNGIAATGP
jgi:hypothetical protein